LKKDRGKSATPNIVFPSAMDSLSLESPKNINSIHDRYLQREEYRHSIDIRNSKSWKRKTFLGCFRKEKIKN
jgi:hypothetical protein